jgi:ABC-type multidrug transport system ATPase subunit
MVTVENLRVEFPRVQLFNGLSFNIQAGEKVALKGESGSGKSTLLNVLTGFIPRFSGKVMIDGLALTPVHVGEIRRRTAWVPQELGFTVFPTVRSLFYAPFAFKANRAKRPSSGDLQEIFKRFEISPSLLDREIKEISGGQKQRIILAGAVLLKKPLLLLDEPTSALNTEIKTKITDYILGLPDVTVIAATHDEYFLEKADRVIEI